MRVFRTVITFRFAFIFTFLNSSLFLLSLFFLLPFALHSPAHLSPGFRFFFRFLASSSSDRCFQRLDICIYVFAFEIVSDSIKIIGVFRCKSTPSLPPSLISLPFFFYFPFEVQFFKLKLISCFTFAFVCFFFFFFLGLVPQIQTFFNFFCSPSRPPKICSVSLLFFLFSFLFFFSF